MGEVSYEGELLVLDWSHVHYRAYVKSFYPLLIVLPAECPCLIFVDRSRRRVEPLSDVLFVVIWIVLPEVNAFSRV